MAQIDKPNLHFNTVLWTGDDSSGHAITGVGFQPDWVWIKNRDTTDDHCIVDSIRGNTKVIVSNSSAAEITSTQRVQSFDSDGITVGADNDTNKSGSSIVGWNWLAGGSASSNSDGSITSSVSANTTAGFSIVKWTGNGVAGASIGHGLGVIPKMIIVKRTNASGNNWTVYHASLGNTHRLELNNTTASTSDGGAWNNNTPTSTVFYTGNNLTVGNSGSTYIAYCFSSKTGYSKVGSYAGNNNANGTFVYTGFKPSFLMIKYTGSSQNWLIIDNKRPGYNLISAGDSQNLRPNTNDAEVTSNGIDLLSNGFKCRSSDGDSNGYTNPYIYIAFAENPIVGSNNIPATAR